MKFIDIINNYIFEQNFNQNNPEITKIINDLIEADKYNKSMSMINTKEEKEDAKNKRDSKISELIFKINELTENPKEKEEIVEDIIKNKISSDDLLGKTIQKFYTELKDVKPIKYPKITRKDKSELSFADRNKLAAKNYYYNKKLENPNRRTKTERPYEVKDKILNFKEGNVHKIILYPPSDTHNRVWVTIYRILSEKDKQDLDLYGKYDGISYNYLDEKGNNYLESDNHKEDIYQIKKEYTDLVKGKAPQKKTINYYAVLNKNQEQQISNIEEKLNYKIHRLIPITKLNDVKKNKNIFYTYLENYRLLNFIKELEDGVLGKRKKAAFKPKAKDPKKVAASAFGDTDTFEYSILLRRVVIIHKKLLDIKTKLLPTLDNKIKNTKSETNKKNFIIERDKLIKEKEEAIKEKESIIDEILYELKKYTDDEKIKQLILTDYMPSSIKYSALVDEIRKRYDEIKSESNNKKITEMSSTGGSASANTSAATNYGTGEGIASKYAFASNKKTKTNESYNLSKKYKELFKKEIKDI